MRYKRLDTSPNRYSAPSAIVALLVGELGNGELLLNLGATLSRCALGLLFGCTSGLAMGLFLDWSARLRALLDPIVGALYLLPKLALFPLFLIIFGLGETPRVVLVSLAAFFPMVINTLAGVRQINAEYFDVGHSYGASTFLLLRRVILPGSMPSVLSDLRLAVENALITTIAVELLNATTGLGAQIWWAWETLRTEALYVAVVLAAFIGIGSHDALEFIGKRAIPWQSDREEKGAGNPILEI
jgi:ABC-type nitrate/sulfonate/bicarbonate transport system permease component